MLKEWEEFKGRPSVRKTDRPRVTLNRDGVFLFNNLAVKAIGKPDAVVFFFNRRIKCIGIRVARPKALNAFPLHRNEVNYLNRVSGKPFCRYNRINVDRTIAFEDIKVINNSFMILDLSKAEPIASAHPESDAA